MKKYLITALTMIVAFSLMQSASLADKGRGHHRAKTVKEKFFKKVKMVYKYQDELKVSDKQMDQIHEVKIALKKDLIRKGADLDIIKVDIHSLLRQDKVDVEAVNKLLDQKYAIKNAKTKKAVEAYAKLKTILTSTQLSKLKDLSRQHKYKDRDTCKTGNK